MTYRSRPSVSPVVATLFAARVLRRSDRVLDLGCGTGNDCLTLARWGIRSVVGLDDDEDCIDEADEHLERLRRQLDEPLPQVEFHLGSVTSPHECFPNRSFTFAIDSLLWTNLSAFQKPGYAREVARILAPRGRLVIQARLDARVRIYDSVAASEFIPPSFMRLFSFGPLIATHIPENPRWKGTHGKAGVALCIGTKRARPLHSA